MLQGSPQFTPRQLLEAGRRAEAEGKLADADQLYRHLADHFAYTAEAAEARNGLGRIGGGPAQQVWSGNGGDMPASWPTALDRSEPAQQRSVKSRRVAAERNYLAGRAIAWLFSILGWVAVAAGAGAALLPLASDPSSWQRTLPSVLTAPLAMATPMAGVALAAAGIALIFLAQLAFALFDQADASRELLALERARQRAERG